MIIIEGPDGAGKTTLAKRLAKDLGVELKDWGVPRDEMPNVGVRQRVYESLSDAVRHEARRPVYIHDRLYWSEIVYGQVLRGSVAFPVRERKQIREMIYALRCPIIFCLPKFEVVEANVKSSQQMEEVPEFIQQIYSRYCVIYSRLRTEMGNRVRRYDYTGEIQPTASYESIKNLCQEYLDQKEGRLWSSDTTRTQQ